MLGRVETDGSLEFTRLGREDGALLGELDGIAETDGAIDDASLGCEEVEGSKLG